eukprot:1042681-Rhodomonas_salina.3
MIRSWYKLYGDLTGLYLILHHSLSDVRNTRPVARGVTRGGVACWWVTWWVTRSDKGHVTASRRVRARVGARPDTLPLERKCRPAKTLDPTP